ncbi:hypothetical protein SCP_0606730 [Sparassis crispa]|uniref:Deoxyribose-phosphate aldolase n=1 Tax=Sparassis crispa TaxID=139825 RepID=A0A401GSH9_9APHY|nr:hypothetical protein SCP_0606730 [Sparassis crispa]GBE84694.1 hypothetical protein SCP_0606730 [Sparassis crispa]
MRRCSAALIFRGSTTSRRRISRCVCGCSCVGTEQTLTGTGMGICVVIGFPHRNSTTTVKVFEATEAMDALQAFVRAGGEIGGPGLVETDMVVNIGKVLAGEWGYVEHEIAAIDTAAVALAWLSRPITT